jgi:hypothetical protein
VAPTVHHTDSICNLSMLVKCQQKNKDIITSVREMRLKHDGGSDGKGATYTRGEYIKSINPQ